jgi:hypothetical protein
VNCVCMFGHVYVGDCVLEYVYSQVNERTCVVAH